MTSGDVCVNLALHIRVCKGAHQTMKTTKIYGWKPNKLEFYPNDICISTFLKCKLTLSKWEEQKLKPYQGIKPRIDAIQVTSSQFSILFHNKSIHEEAGYWFIHVLWNLTDICIQRFKQMATTMSGQQYRFQ